jgi:hypothetical protein
MSGQPAPSTLADSLQESPPQGILSLHQSYILIGQVVSPILQEVRLLPHASIPNLCQVIIVQTCCKFGYLTTGRAMHQNSLHKTPNRRILPSSNMSADHLSLFCIRHLKKFPHCSTRAPAVQIQISVLIGPQFFVPLIIRN